MILEKLNFEGQVSLLKRINTFFKQNNESYIELIDSVMKNLIG